MNDDQRRVSINKLAMARVNEEVAAEHAAKAIEEALLHPEAVEQEVLAPTPLIVRELEMVLVGDDPARKAAEAAEAQRQRDLDAAMMDTVKIVEAMRRRLKRSDWSHQDGAVVNKIFALLKGMNGDGDAGFGS